ncbi:MAG: molybdopterin molybdotransferase MoeA [Gammaproteobacteria bacterium]|nr:molybdopterin molybdotransferase MoeA [Gammaproteobacteria bacterium]
MQVLTPVNEVIASLLDAAVCTDRTERVGISHAMGRIAAEDQVSAVNVPPGDNSAMDGYALNVESGMAIKPGVPLSVSQRIPAGNVGEELAPGTLARIFTGAELPAGANAVIMQEQVDVAGDQVVLQRLPRIGENVRQWGQDICKGQLVIEQGTKLDAPEMGLLASIGLADVSVYKKLKIALLTTGDELVQPGTPLNSGQIYNSNLYLMQGLIHKLNMEVVELDVVADEPDKTEEALRFAAEHSDCIVSSGGVSVGDEDYVKSAVEKLGKLDIWRIKMKPGKPLAFGEVLGTPFFGLPGNPVSTFVTFCILARPYLLKYQGCSTVLPRMYKFPSGFDYQGGSRLEYLRVRLRDDGRGGTEIEKYPQQGSGILTSTSWATALAVIEPESSIEKGQHIGVLLKQDLVGT